MHEERRAVDLLAADGSITAGEFLIRASGATDPDRVELTLTWPDRQSAVTAPDSFDALVLLRLGLEPLGLTPLCWGASLQVYPSDASRAEGIGAAAYRLTLGQFPRATDQVNIFESGPGLVAATVAEQEEFSRAWFDSLADA